MVSVCLRRNLSKKTAADPSAPTCGLTLEGRNGQRWELTLASIVPASVSRLVSSACELPEPETQVGTMKYQNQEFPYCDFLACNLPCLSNRGAYLYSYQTDP